MDMFDVNPDKAKRGLCCVRTCRGRPGQPNRGNGLFCRRCRQRRHALKNPISVAYSKLKWNAKRRAKQFDLTLVQFTTFCADTDYVELKGKQGAALSIDRIRAGEGYTAGNIQVLTLTENSRKAHLDGSYANHAASRPDLQPAAPDSDPFGARD